MTRSAPPGAAEARQTGLLALLAYALPAAATQFILAPFTTVLPGIYVTHFGLDAAVVGVALLVMRIADAVTDPLVGYLSDRTGSRLGPRKPWLIGGALIAMGAGWLVLAPVGAPSVWSLIFWSVLFYLGWTMMEIPHAAWGAELSREPATRTTVFFLRAACGVAGGVGFAALPFLPLFESPEITPRTLAVVAVAFCLLAPVTVLAAVFGAPARPPGSAPPERLGRFLRSLGRNRPLWLFLAAFAASGVSFGMFASLQYLYLSAYLQLGPRVAHALAVSFAGAIVALPIWLAIVRRWGKHRPWCVGLVIIGGCMAGLALLPPQPGAFWPYVALAGLISVSGGAGMIAPFSLLGDIVDYDTLRTGQRRGGAFFALFTLVIKANVAVGGGLAFLILGWAGFDARAAVQAPQAAWAMKAAFCLVPAVLAFTAAGLLWRFPLDARRHALIRRRIESLERRAAAAD